MGWEYGKFYYTTALLRSIAENYATIYEGFPLSWDTEETNPWSIAEYKADFDMALKGVGKRDYYRMARWLNGNL